MSSFRIEQLLQTLSLFIFAAHTDGTARSGYEQGERKAHPSRWT